MYLLLFMSDIVWLRDWIWNKLVSQLLQTTFHTKFALSKVKGHGHEYFLLNMPKLYPRYCTENSTSTIVLDAEGQRQDQQVILCNKMLLNGCPQNIRSLEEWILIIPVPLILRTRFYTWLMFSRRGSKTKAARSGQLKCYQKFVQTFSRLSEWYWLDLYWR